MTKKDAGIRGTVCAAVVVVAMAGVPLFAEAQILTLTSTGYITYGLDPANLFGAGTNLQGVAYTAVAQFDTSLGNLDIQNSYTRFEGGYQYGYPSLGSGVITINGHSGLINGAKASTLTSGIGAIQAFSTLDEDYHVSPTGVIYDSLIFAADRTDNAIPQDPRVPLVGNYCAGATECEGSFSITRSDPGAHLVDDTGLANQYLSYVSARFQQTSMTITLPINTGGGHFAGPPHPGGVPEPAAWTLMLIGFAALGGAIRTRRAATA